MSIRERQPVRITLPQPHPERDPWSRDVTDVLNTLPQMSTFSYDDPNSNVSATPGTWGSNIKDGAASMWVKASGDTSSGWQSVATEGVYTQLSDLSARVQTTAAWFTPATVEFVSDDGNSGSVSNVRTYLDGNVIQVEEAATTPGFETLFIFSDVTYEPQLFVTAYKYTGTPASHEVDVQFYDYEDSAYKAVAVIASTNTETRTIAVPNLDRFMSNGNMRVRFYHADNGVASHAIRYDFVGFRYDGYV
jgi:hypothetical protein